MNISAVSEPRTANTETRPTRSVSAVEVRGLHKKYALGLFGQRRFHALRGIDLEVRQGEVFGLLGPNGAGKTTLIKVLLGIVRGSSGHASVMGQPAGSKAARRLIGYLPENMQFPSHHTAVTALQLYGRLSSVPESAIRERSKDLLRMVGLDGREQELVRRYSKGMRQRLALAQALLHEPELLVMDEPTDGLDPVGRAEMRSLIMRLKEQCKTVFLNSHILQEVELVCDRVAILAEGTIRGVGTPAELTKQFHTNETEVIRLELIGDSAQIDRIVRSMATSHASVQSLQLPNGSWQVSLPTGSQGEVDQMIDELRNAHISIHKLERSQRSLEEVFLSVVNNKP